MNAVLCYHADMLTAWIKNNTQNKGIHVLAKFFFFFNNFLDEYAPISPSTQEKVAPLATHLKAMQLKISLAANQLESPMYIEFCQHNCHAGKAGVQESNFSHAWHQVAFQKSKLTILYIGKCQLSYDLYSPMHAIP